MAQLSPLAELSDMTLTILSSPMSDVNDDILLLIWQFIDDIGAGPYVPFILASVCRRWRTLALNTSYLWAKLRVSMDSGDLSPDMKLRLERSQQAPLAIRFERSSSSAFEALAACIDRWESIYFDAESRDKVIDELIVWSDRDVSSTSNSITSFSFLTSVTIDLGFSAERSDAPKLDWRIWPQLTTFNITCSSITPWLPTMPPSIRELSIRCVQLSEEQLQEICSLCPNVVEFDMTALRIQSETNSLSLPPLPRLRKVTLRETFTLRMLGAVARAAPNLDFLVLKRRPLGGSEMFPDAGIPFPNQITTLYIDLMSTMLHCGDPIAQLLGEMSKLRSLTIFVRPKPDIGRRPNITPVLGRLSDANCCPQLTEFKLYNVAYSADHLLTLAGKMSGDLRTFQRPRFTLVGCDGMTRKHWLDLFRLVDIENHNESESDNLEF